MEYGIVIAGEVLGGTGWCLREPGAWWDPTSKVLNKKWKRLGWKARDRYQLQRRKGTLDILTGHWTAGEAGIKDIMDDGRRVTSIMKRRGSYKDPDRRLKVSVAFIIGACTPEDQYAPVWQTMDLGLGWAGVHVGRRSVNRRSAGVEVVSAGRDGQTNIRDRDETTVQYLGRMREVLQFYPGQLRSWVRLANTLSDGCLPGDIEIPRQVPCSFNNLEIPKMERFTRQEQRKWKGAMEHYLMNGTTKIDAGTLLLQALLDDGWKGIEI